MKLRVIVLFYKNMICSLIFSVCSNCSTILHSSIYGFWNFPSLLPSILPSYSFFLKKIIAIINKLQVNIILPIFEMYTSWMMVHICNRRAWEPEGGELWVWRQAWLHNQYPFSKHKMRGCRWLSGLEHLLSGRSQVQFQTPTRLPQTIPNSSPRGPNILLYPLQALNMYVACIHTCWQSTHNIKNR